MIRYQTVYLSQIANAYGFSVQTLTVKIKREVSKRDENSDQVKNLGQWSGKRLLMPVQVRAIVEMLGECSNPEHIEVTK